MMALDKKIYSVVAVGTVTCQWKFVQHWQITNLNSGCVAEQ